MNCCSLLILIFGFLTKYAYSLESESIVGGDEAAEGQFKYQVSIETRRDNLCGGGIIGDRHILTAAHCVVKPNGNFFGVSLSVLGNSLLAKLKYDPEVVRVDVEKIYVLKAYQPKRPKNVHGPYRSVADIAVLRLAKSLDLANNPNLAQLSLPQPHDSVYPNYVGGSAIIAGYGYNWVKLHKGNDPDNEIELGGGSNDFLKYGKTKVIPNDVCGKINRKPVAETHICAQIEQRSPRVPEGVCTGDSGSPLVFDGTTVIGVLSTSPNGCKENVLAAVYT